MKNETMSDKEEKPTPPKVERPILKVLTFNKTKKKKE
jgi:hypothetical protein